MKNMAPLLAALALLLQLASAGASEAASQCSGGDMAACTSAAADVQGFFTNTFDDIKSAWNAVDIIIIVTVVVAVFLFIVITISNWISRHANRIHYELSMKKWLKENEGIENEDHPDFPHEWKTMPDSPASDDPEMSEKEKTGGPGSDGEHPNTKPNDKKGPIVNVEEVDSEVRGSV